MITGAQIRKARALLGWPAYRLARRIKLPTETIHRAESVEGEPPLTIERLVAIQRGLEAAGVVFTNGDEPGVKLRIGTQNA
jgi:ribosome-binding protein aMBF1 (putative translation factor)